MSPRQILLILRMRWWIVLLTLVVVVGAGGIFTALMPRQYSADTSLLLDVKADPLIATFMPAAASPAYLATQTEIIKSDRIAGRVVQMMGLDKNPAALAQWKEDTQGRQSLESYYGTMLQRGLQVEALRGSNVLQIAYTGADPKFAAAVANSFARAYIDLSIDLRVEPARQYASFFDDRLKSLRTEYEAAQARLSEFQQKKGIVVSDERMDQEMARLTALQNQISSAQAERADFMSRQRNSGGESSPDVQQSAVVQGLKAQLATAETKLQEMSANYGSSHPRRIEMEAQIAGLRQQLAAEMRRVSGATSTVSRQSAQKLDELRAIADEQKRKVLSLRAERDEIAVLVKDVETAQRAYEAVAQRRSQTSLESKSEQAAARVLSPAVEPIAHSKPNIPKNMAAAVVAGLALGIGIAIGLEFLDRRIRSEADLMVFDGVPLLGVMSSRPVKRWYGHRPQLPSPRQMPPQLTLDGGT